MMKTTRWRALCTRGLAVILLSAGTGTASESRTGLLAAVQVSPHSIALAGPEEPGRRLTLYGTVIDHRSGAPIREARIELYQTDAAGAYRPRDPADESTARLSGEVLTGDSGQFIVETILPGEYGPPGNRHIHIYAVRADGYRTVGRVILFADDVNDEVRRWAEETGFGIIIELHERDGRLEGHPVIRLSPE